MTSFEEIVRDEGFALADAFLAFATREYPSLDQGAYIRRLDEIGEGFRSGDSGRSLESLGAYLSGLGFRGNSSQFEDPRNSFLNEVLDRGLGIPISLSAVWIETGLRAGMPVYGVGMPMHFLVGMESSYADPFNGGTVLDRDGVVGAFGRLVSGRVPWNDDYLRASPPRAIVRRALTNLKAIFGATGQLARALWVCDCILSIPDVAPAEHKERAAVLSALARHREAIADLRAYLRSDPDDADETELEIRRLQSAMN